MTEHNKLYSHMLILQDNCTAKRGMNQNPLYTDRQILGAFANFLFLCACYIKGDPIHITKEEQERAIKIAEKQAE